jgi:hypothetical protein
MPYVLEPLGAGQLGGGTLLDVSAHPPLVSRVQYVLDAPTSDDLIESFPVFLVSEALGSALMETARSPRSIDRCTARGAHPNLRPGTDESAP